MRPGHKLGRVALGDVMKGKQRMRMGRPTCMAFAALLAAGCMTQSGPQWRPPTDAVKVQVAAIAQVLRQGRIATVHYTDGRSAPSVGFHFNSGKLCFADLTGHFVSCPTYDKVASVTPGVDVEGVPGAPLMAMYPPATNGPLDAASAAGRKALADAIGMPDGAVVLSFHDGVEFAALVGTPQDTRFCFGAVAMRQGGGAWLELDDGWKPGGLHLFCERYSSLAAVRAGWPQEMRGAIAERPLMKAQDAVRYDPALPANVWKKKVEARETTNFIQLFRSAIAQGDPVVTLILGDRKQVVTDLSFRGDRLCYCFIVQTDDAGRWLDERNFRDMAVTCMGPNLWLDDAVSGDIRKRG
jgi:hypothetical protein